jgi:ubiquinone/menaquinone biosynthesis C-methylase UbiE
MKADHKTPSDWTGQNIADFWDWQSKHGAGNHYFTASMSAAITTFLKSKKILKGKVLDYGCGAGHFLQQLIKETSLELYGLDFSADSVEETTRKTNQQASVQLFRDFPTMFADNEFDLITFIETIEHLQDDMLHSTLNEIYRILKPGGKVFITTPFNEKLEKHMAFCPFCRSVFHHMQHMRSFTTESLKQLLMQHNFKIEYCDNVDLEKWKLGTFKYHIKKNLKAIAIAAGLKEKGNDSPNLIAIISK